MPTAMELFQTACGDIGMTSMRPTVAHCKRNKTARMVAQAVQAGAHTKDHIESYLMYLGVDVEVAYLNPETALACIELIRLSGYAIVLQPLIPDFGNQYAINWEAWRANPTVREARFGALALLSDVRIFETGSAATEYHTKRLKAWNAVSPVNACRAPPAIRYRADLWQKVRDHVSYIHRVRPYAMFWMEEAAKRSMYAEFDENGQAKLIGRGAKRERDAAMEMLTLLESSKHD